MLQLLSSGLVSGLEIALLAAAFQVAYLPSRIFFISLGGVYVAAPYVMRSVWLAGFGVSAGVLAALAGGAILAMLMFAGNHMTLRLRHAPPAAHLISSLGLYIIIVQIVVLASGAGAQSFPSALDGGVQFGAPLTSDQWFSLIAATCGLIAYAAALEFTPFGLRLRALAANPRQFSLYGYNSSRYFVAAFGVSGFLAAGSAILRANSSGFDPYVGLSALLLAVVAVIVGGGTSFVAPIVGAIVLGVARVGIAWFFDARWQDAGTFLILALALIAMPRGIVSFRRRVESV